MTPGQLQLAAPYLAVGLLALALVFFLISLRYFRKSRTDFYWRRRRTAGQRGWRLFVWSLGLMLVSGLICLATGVAGVLNPRPIPTSGPTRVVLASSSTPTVTITSTIQPSATPSATGAATVTPVVYPTTQEPTELAVKSATQTASGTASESVTEVATEAATLATLEPTRSLTGSPPMQSPTQTVTTFPTASETTAATQADTGTTTLEPGGASTQVTATQATTAPTSTQTLTVTPTDTLRPTVTPQPSFTSSPTATETLVRAPLTNTVLDSSVTPGPNAKLSITALDSRISADFKPVAPATTFSAGFNRIYYFITFTGMQSGVLWRRQLLKDGSLIDDSAYLWGMAQDGDAYFFFGQEGGFQAGSYEIRLFIGQTDQPVTAATFTVK